MSEDLFKTKIDAAKDLIKAAEDQLGVALGELEVRPRAEKTTASKVIEDAFTRLRAARERLLTLELAVSDDEEGGD